MRIHGDSSQLFNRYVQRATSEDKEDRGKIGRAVGDRPGKTSDDGASRGDRDMKSGGDEAIIERGSPWLDDKEQQSALHEHLETQKAFSELGGELQGTTSKLGGEAQEAFSDHDRKTQEALADCDQEQQQKEDEEGPVSGLAKPDGPIPPVLRKLTISGDIPQILVSHTRSRRVHTGVVGAALHNSLPTIDDVGREADGDHVLACDNGDVVAMQVTLDLAKRMAGDIIPEPKNRQQAMK